MIAEIAREYSDVGSPEDNIPPSSNLELVGPSSDLERLVDRFDQEWRQEGLPEDWYNFGKAGFSMKSQMELLQDLDEDSRTLWTKQTDRDIRGFAIEYLKQDIVHPAFYRKIEDGDGRTHLVDEIYEKELTDMVSPQERGGSVRRVLGEIEEHIGSGGNAAIMISPKGETGLHMDDGSPIEYPDSWFFTFVDMGDQVVNFGVKTDFTPSECREAILRLTGQELPIDAELEDYVSAVAMIDSNQGNVSPVDLVNILREVRSSPYVIEDKTWDDVDDKVRRIDELYDLEFKAEAYIQEFEEFVLEGGHSKLDLQKALAATLLRLSELYVVEEKQTKKNWINYKVAGGIIYVDGFQDQKDVNVPSYGQILSEVESIEGCAGGSCSSINSFNNIDSVSLEVQLGGKDEKGYLKFPCPSCGEINTRPPDGYVYECKNKENCPDPTAVLPASMQNNKSVEI